LLDDYAMNAMVALMQVYAPEEWPKEHDDADKCPCDFISTRSYYMAAAMIDARSTHSTPFSLKLILSVMKMTMLDPLGDGKSSLRLLDFMGNSLSVVNDARQSFDAESAEWTERDGKLLRYLAKHHHTSPFRGVVFKWSVKAPLFVARQWWKHTVASTFVDDQLGWNEKSFRYCAADEAEFTFPLSSCSKAKTIVKRLQGLLMPTNKAWPPLSTSVLYTLARKPMQGFC
jgi:hypothetical protein